MKVSAAVLLFGFPQEAESLVYVVHGFCTVHRPEHEEKMEKIMGSFLLLGSKYLHQLSLSWSVDDCTWNDCSEISSQSREKNTHFSEICSFRCVFCDQINLLNRFFLSLIGVWVNASSSWHISFRDKSDSGLLNMHCFCHPLLNWDLCTSLGKVLWYKLIYSSSTSFLLFATSSVLVLKLPSNPATSSCISCCFPDKVSFLLFTVFLY